MKSIERNDECYENRKSSKESFRMDLLLVVVVCFQGAWVGGRCPCPCYCLWRDLICPEDLV